MRVTSAVRRAPTEQSPGRPAEAAVVPPTGGFAAPHSSAGTRATGATPAAAGVSGLAAPSTPENAATGCTPRTARYQPIRLRGPRPRPPPCSLGRAAGGG